MTVSDVIAVQDGFPLSDVSVAVDVSHRRVGALVLTLTAAPTPGTGAAPTSRAVVLKERGLGQLGDNMYMTTFTDSATQAFPVPAASCGGRAGAHVVLGDGSRVCWR
jgi:subtilisin-like proprotein convertase family protein